MTIIFKGELQLLRWSETSNGGATVTFQLADSADLDNFKDLTLAKKGIAGQIIAAMMKTVDEESPAEKPKGGKNSQWVAMRCNEPEFREFLAAKFYGGKPITSTEAAAEEVRFICSVDSRAELDSDPIAENRFHELIRIPYSKYINER